MSIASTTTSIVVSKEETSLWDGTKKFLKGDYDGPNALLIDTVLGLVPGVGQVIDAREFDDGAGRVAHEREPGFESSAGEDQIRQPGDQ